MPESKYQKLMKILKELEVEKYQGPVTLHLAAGNVMQIEYKTVKKMTN